MRHFASRVLSFFVLAIASCSSSSSSTTANGADAAPADACGPGPYVSVRVGALSYTTHLPLSGATVVLDACPDRSFTTDQSGSWTGEVTSGLPFDPRIEASDFIPSRTGQSIIKADLEAGGSNLFFPTSVQSSFFPELTATTPVLLAVAFLPPGTQASSDPCSTRDGVTFAVAGHPEAKIIYYGGTEQQPAPDSTLTATTSIGAAEISGLAATNGPEIELTATKASCAISFTSYPHTGKYTLENGVLTVAGAFMPPIASP